MKTKPDGAPQGPPVTPRPTAANAIHASSFPRAPGAATRNDLGPPAFWFYPVTQIFSCAIGVMAKAPQPGRSKTRLCPPLLPEQAATLSAAFLRDTTENMAEAARSAPIACYAAYAPLGTEALLHQHLAAGTRLVPADGSPPMPDRVQGFGRCLLHAIQGMLDDGHAAACVLSSDSPTLPTALLARAAELLAAPGDRTVFCPSDDGGYYLLGLKSAHAALFADINWSTEQVAAQTRARAREIGLEMIELPNWYDVDDLASLSLLLRETGGYPAPATNAAIDHLGLRRLLATDHA
jgi:rSAM/selenodomain-associated transferase 1